MTRRRADAPDRRAARSSYLQLADFERLEEWGRLLRVLFPTALPYLVGSAMLRSDYRDVDVRVVLDDDVFDASGGASPS